MADIPTRSIAQLPIATSVNGNDKLVISQGGITKTANASQIRPVTPSLSIADDLFVGRDAFVSGTTQTGFLHSVGRTFISPVATSVNAPSSQTVQAALQVNGTDAQSSIISTARFSNNGNAAGISMSKSRGTTIGDYTVVQTNDLLGGIFWGAANGSYMGQAAVIYCNIIDTAPSVTSLQSELQFRTNGPGSATPTTVLKISTSGVSLPVTGQTLRMLFKTPSSAGDAGRQGDFCYDPNYIFICVADNTWRRTPALATW